MNLYAYVVGNPVNFADPMGLMKKRLREGRIEVMVNGADGEMWFDIGSYEREQTFKSRNSSQYRTTFRLKTGQVITSTVGRGRFGDDTLDHFVENFEFNYGDDFGSRTVAKRIIDEELLYLSQGSVTPQANHSTAFASGANFEKTR